MLSFLIGIISIILALTTTDMLSLMLIANNSYIPIVTVPFLSAIFGFRTTSKSVLIGITTDFSTVILWNGLW